MGVCLNFFLCKREDEKTNNDNSSNRIIENQSALRNEEGDFE